VQAAHGRLTVDPQGPKVYDWGAVWEKPAVLHGKDRAAEFNLLARAFPAAH